MVVSMSEHAFVCISMRFYLGEGRGVVLVGKVARGIAAAQQRMRRNDAVRQREETRVMFGLRTIYIISNRARNI